MWRGSCLVDGVWMKCNRGGVVHRAVDAVAELILVEPDEPCEAVTGPSGLSSPLCAAPGQGCDKVAAWAAGLSGWSTLPVSCTLVHATFAGMAEVARWSPVRRRRMLRR